MRVVADHLCRIAGVVDQDFLRGDQHVYRVAIDFYVKRAVGRELQQVQAGEVGQAESSKNMYSEHGFEALMRAVFCWCASG